MIPVFPDQVFIGAPGSYLNLPNIDLRSVFVPRAGVEESAELVSYQYGFEVPVILMKEPL